eukprot:jgi/Botrbrau1/15040/Bobra.320_2s0013.3
MDIKTKETVQKIPLLTVKEGPRNKEQWEKRLKEELKALIHYITLNKNTDSDWFTITSNKEGTHWSGKCWYVHNLIKYEFAFEFDIPATYPTVSPEIKIPELDGKTAKMYRGGAICLTVHFKPLWAKNSPHFGIAHALCLGLAPWLAAEVPHLVETGVVKAS